MDKWVAVRFFKVQKMSKSHTSLVDVLETIGNMDEVESREKSLAQNFHVRIEIFDKDGKDAIVGELTRIQTTNLPSQIGKGKRGSLQRINRLGHGIVFRFDHRKGILGLQHDQRTLATFRFFQYLSAWDIMAQYKTEAVVREDMWDRFAKKDARVLEIGIAKPGDLGSVAGPSEAVLTAASRMGKAYSSPNIVVRLAMGHYKGALSHDVKAVVKDLLDRWSKQTIDLTKLKAKSADEQGNDPIDLLAEVLEYKEELELHDRDPDVNYEIKLEYLKRCMRNVK